MAPDTTVASKAGIEAEIMAAVDGEGSKDLVIADIYRDEAWLSMPLADAVAVPDWC